MNAGSPRSPRPTIKQVANGIPFNDRASEDLAVIRPPPSAEIGANSIKAVLFTLVKAAAALDVASLDRPWPTDHLRRIRVKGGLIPVAGRHPNAGYTHQGDVVLPVQEGTVECKLYCTVNARISNLVDPADAAAMNSFRIVSIPLVEVVTLSGLTCLAPAPNCPMSITESFEFVTRRSFPNLAARPPLPPIPAGGPHDFAGLPFKGFIALTEAEIPTMAHNPDAIAMAYAADAPHFLGAGHPDWRRLGDAPIAWVYSLNPNMMAEAQRAAVTEHQLESFNEWMVNAEHHGGLDLNRLAGFARALLAILPLNCKPTALVQSGGFTACCPGWSSMQVSCIGTDNIFGDVLNEVPLLGGGGGGDYHSMEDLQLAHDLDLLMGQEQQLWEHEINPNLEAHW